MRRRKPASPASGPELASAIPEVVADYLEFLRAAEDEAASKAFAAKYAAAKAALAHIEQLQKLSGGEAAGKIDEYHALLGEMRRDMNAASEETAQDDDGDAG